MTAAIARLSGAEAYDLIYPQYLATLPELDQETMKRSMANSSRVWVGYDGGKVLCCWGLIAPTLLSDRAYLWLYTTDHMKEYVFTFVRQSQRAVSEMLEEFPIIVGHCAITSPKSMRWLRWLGAKFGDPQGPVIPFTIEAKS